MKNGGWVTISVAWALTAPYAHAVTLGDVSRPVVIGRSLDVHIPLTLQRGERLGSQCFGAQVFYGDTREPASVSTGRPEQSDSDAKKQHILRVTSAAAVYEPLVYIDVKVGCQTPVTKRFTLLAMLAGEVQVPSTPTPTPPAVLAPATLKPDLPPLSGQTPAPTPSSRATSPGKVAATPAPSVVRKLANRPDRRSGRAALLLEALDLRMDYAPTLKLSNELTLPPSEDLEARALASARWRALNAIDVPPTAASNVQIQAEIAAIQALSTATQKSMVDLQEKIERAEAARYANAVVYVLLALCLALLAGLAFLWRRARTQPVRAWNDGLQHETAWAPDSDIAPLATETPEPPPAETPSAPQGNTLRPARATPPTPAEYSPPLAAAAVPEASADALDLDLNLNEGATPSPKGRQDQIVATPAERPVAERMDTRRQAIFFTEMGLFDKAIDVLTSHIAQCGEASPMACLDLLNVYHLLGREDDYAFLRNEFNHWFTGVVPAFAAFKTAGRPLESYTEVIDRITQGWPAPATLDYIEHCLYRHTGEAQGLDFDLGAYKELWLLHSIAKRLVRQSGSETDGYAYELLRIPGHTPGQESSSTSEAPDSRASAHRAGAHLRGSWHDDATPHGATAAPEGPQNPMGAMRIPPPQLGASNEVPTPPSPPSAAPAPEMTDFNFLGLR